MGSGDIKFERNGEDFTELIKFGDPETDIVGIKAENEKEYYIVENPHTSRLRLRLGDPPTATDRVQFSRTDLEIGVPIASGGFADVFVGRCNFVADPIAFKMLKAKHSPANREFNVDSPAAKMAHEAETLLQFDHPNIIKCFDFEIVKLDGLYTPIVVMQLIKDAQRFESVTNVDYDLNTLISYFEQIAGAIDYVHSKGLVHGDIGPKNFLIEPGTGKIYLSDFSEAKRIGSSGANFLSGTPGLCQFSLINEENKTGVTTMRDKWGFVASMFKILGGKLPFGEFEETTMAIQSPDFPGILLKFSSDPQLLKRYGPRVCDNLDLFFNRFLVDKQFMDLEKNEEYTVSNLANVMSAILRNTIVES